MQVYALLDCETDHLFCLDTYSALNHSVGSLQQMHYRGLINVLLQGSSRICWISSQLKLKLKGVDTTSVRTGFTRSPFWQ